MVSEDIKKRVGQHFVVGFHGTTPSPEIRYLLQECYVGGIILMKRNMKSVEQTRNLISELQDLARVKPLLVAVDQENGLVKAFGPGTQFPGAMALAATGDLSIVERVSNAAAQQLKSVGFNWVFAPVGDVNSDAANPVIGVRSFGDDPSRVAEYVVAASRGFVSGGIAPTIKHFPGHGDTHVDSHLALPVIPKSKEELQKVELVPFAAAFKDKIPSVMTAHVYLPQLTKQGLVEDLTSASQIPASLSEEITSHLLRTEMGFDGVVVTDCLEMEAVRSGLGVEHGSYLALKAGADAVLICHTFETQRAAIERVWEEVENGGLALDSRRLDDLRTRFCTLATTSPAWVDFGSLAKEAYQASTTIVWDRGVLPLKGKILLLTPQTESINLAVDDEAPPTNNRAKACDGYTAFKNALQPVQHHVYGQGDAPPPLTGGVDAVVLVLRNANLRRWQVGYLQQLTKITTQLKIPVVFVSTCGPYDLVGVGEEVTEKSAYLVTYEYTPMAMECAADVLLGKKDAVGKFPVHITFDT